MEIATPSDVEHGDPMFAATSNAVRIYDCYAIAGCRQVVPREDTEPELPEHSLGDLVDFARVGGLAAEASCEFVVQPAIVLAAAAAHGVPRAFHKRLGVTVSRSC